MARPVNEEMKRSIEQAAFELFDEVGYDKATYAAIAERRGIGRNLVQYHFPKKEMLAMAYMENLLDSIQESLSLTTGDFIEDNSKLTDVGTAFFENLTSTEGRRTFLLDIIRSRDLTEDVLAFNAAWALEHIGATDSDIETNDQAMRSVIVNMGGFYELLYHSLKNNKPMDIHHELAQVVDSFIDAVG